MKYKLHGVFIFVVFLVKCEQLEVWCGKELFTPTYEEQTAIATILSDMDTEIQGLQTRLTKTQDIKQDMMQELLTEITLTTLTINN